jgi:hypothetical protein
MEALTKASQRSGLNYQDMQRLTAAVLSKAVLSNLPLPNGAASKVLDYSPLVHTACLVPCCNTRKGGHCGLGLALVLVHESCERHLKDLVRPCRCFKIFLLWSPG